MHTYFHKHDTTKASKKIVQKIQTTTGRILEDFAQIKEATIEHYGKLYSQEQEEEDEGDQQALLENIPTSITKEENEALIREISEEEIQNPYGVWAKIRHQGRMDFLFISLKFSGK
jgi:hypothetical protein